MKRVVASILAMTSGWAAMNIVMFVYGWMESGKPEEGVLIALLYGFFSAFVIALAWLVIFMPIYVFSDRQSVIFLWRVALPLGFFGGFVIGYFFLGDATIFWLLASIVGGVAATVGKILLDVIEPIIPIQN